MSKGLTLDAEARPHLLAARYHYEGQPAQMIDGKLTVRLRRDVKGVRNEIYKDLYYAVTELDDETCTVKSVKYICCVAACKKNISMYVRNGFIVFETIYCSSVSKLG